jgi:hypothetical protein
MSLKIGCLAWGSLVWDPRTLPRAGSFQADGPELPIEFSRVSLDGRVTLVIDANAPKLRTLWVELATSTLDEAVAALGRREKIAPERWVDWVGRYRRGDRVRDETGPTDFDAWLETHRLDAVVWTALPSRTPTGELVVPRIEELLAHLAGLGSADRARAEQYVRRAPRSVRTPHRARFESELGWLPDGG